MLSTDARDAGPFTEHGAQRRHREEQQKNSSMSLFHTTHLQICCFLYIITLCKSQHIR